MIGRNKRGIRRASMRVRLAVAAAVLVGGGAAGVVGVAASHSSTTNAQSAGYYTHSHNQPMLSESHAMSAAMNWWSRSPQTSLSLISRMTTMNTFSMTSFHHHMLVLQRGTVIAATRNAFVIKSTNGKLELWNVNGGTKFLNVGGTQTGWNAMSGGAMSSYGSWNWSNSSSSNWNMRARTLAKGDLVFIFGERVHNRLIAQLVLFVAPFQTTPVVTPTAAPTATMTTPVVTPTATATSNVQSPVQSSGGTSFSGSHS